MACSNEVRAEAGASPAGIPVDYVTSRDDGSKPAIFVYDGHCVLCSAMARHVRARDGEQRVRLVAAQSQEGKTLYQEAKFDAETPTTNLFVERDGRILTHGDSSIRIFEEIGYPAALTRAARLVPKTIRDKVYTFVARSRFRLFGRHETCQFVSQSADSGLYRRVLGAKAFERLPEAVRRLHDGGGTAMIGIADVTRRRGLAAWLICEAFGLPATGSSIPLAVTVTRQGAGERWTRSFGGRVTISHQRTSHHGALTERFGPMLVEVGVEADAQGMVLSPRKAWLAGFPLPKLLTPGGYGREGSAQGEYRFDVEIRYFGQPIVRYVGSLRPEATVNSG